MLCLIVFGCQYQCNWLPGKTRLRNDLLCVEWDVKPYTLTHSLRAHGTITAAETKSSKMQACHSIATMKFPNFTWLCLTLFPDPSEAQVAISFMQYLVGSCSPTPTTFHRHFASTYTECAFTFLSFLLSFYAFAPFFQNNSHATLTIHTDFPEHQQNSPTFPDQTASRTSQVSGNLVMKASITRLRPITEDLQQGTVRFLTSTQHTAGHFEDETGHNK